MSAAIVEAELKARIEKLEQFKVDLEKKIYAATAVAAALGLAGIIGGVWVTSLARSLTDLTHKTDQLQTNLSQWDQQLQKSLMAIESEKTRAVTDLSSRASSTSTQLAQDSEKMLQQHQAALARTLELKLAEASRSTAADKIIAKLTGGTLDIAARSIQIRNDQGTAVAVMAVTNEGDGFLRINTNKGEHRYQVSLTGKRAQSYFYNQDGNQVLILGTYSDGTTGFIRFRDSADAMTLLELMSDAKGGIVNAYSTNGKKIVYIGPDSNTGNGLVNVMGIRGESAASHSPK
jgi:hypothetical protein